MDNTVYPFREVPYTQVSNYAIDHILQTVAPSTWVVIQVTIRLTKGYHRNETDITLKQYEKLTGLTQPTIIKALAQALDREIIIRKKKGKGFVYSLNRDMAIDLSTKESLVIAEDDNTRNFSNTTKETLANQRSIKENKDNGIIKKSLNKITPATEKKNFKLPNAVAETLEEHFCEQTNILPPDWNDKPSGVYVLWRDPFKQMLKQTIMARLLDNNQEPDPTSTAILQKDIELVKELNRKIINRMKKDRLTISSPKSLLNNFTSELAYHRNGNGAGETNRKKREEAILASLRKYQ